LGSIFLGYFAKDLFVGLGTPFWNPSILILPENNHQFDAEFIPQLVKLLPLFGTLLAVTLGNFIFYRNVDINTIGASSSLLKRVYAFLIFKWYFDVIYNKFINKPLLTFSYTYIFSLLDKGFFEHSGPVFLKTILKNSSTAVRYTNTGFAFRPGYFIVLVFMVGIILAFEFIS
jgi:NADH-ubiquinone oxidoreductase chain 5